MEKKFQYKITLYTRQVELLRVRDFWVCRFFTTETVPMVFPEIVSAMLLLCKGYNQMALKLLSNEGFIGSGSCLTYQIIIVVSHV